MTDKILLKRSLTSGSIPTTASLEPGELAINVHDATVFLKQSGSAQEVIRPLLTLNTDSTGDILLTGSITSTDDITAPNFNGDLLGTASFALTASYAENAEGSGFPFEGDAEITGSLTVSGSFVDFTETAGISGSVFTGSFIGNGAGLTNLDFFQFGNYFEPLQFINETSITVSHHLLTEFPLVQVYDENGAQIIPENIIAVDNSTIIVEFAISTSGWIVIAKGGDVISNFETKAQDFFSETSITVSHNLDTTAPFVQVYDENDEQIIPQVIKIIDENTVRVDFPVETSGKIIITKGGHIVGAGDLSYVAKSFTSESLVTIIHNLNTTAPMVQVYDDSGEQISPDSIRVINASTIEVEFPVTTSGQIGISKGGHVISGVDFSGSFIGDFSGSFTGTVIGGSETAETASLALSVSGSGGRVLYNSADNTTTTSDNLEFDGTNLTVGGQLNASTKSFVIKHQTQPGKKLIYGVSEGPEHSVFIRGKLDDDNVIHLPEEWEWLVDMGSITVQLTPIGKHQKLYVEDIDGLEVKVGNENLMSKSVKCFYLVHGTRKDVEPLQTVI
jgi:hypothetical protein